VSSPRAGPPPADPSIHIVTTRSTSANGSGFSHIALTRLKIADVAPIPSASTATATTVNPGVRSSERTA
jgi:hypothetical protein